MSSAGTGDRNRELIAKSAALLAGDYPLDVLIERLCNAIAVAMDAVVYVAMPNDDDTVRISYATQRGQRSESTSELMPEGSWAARVFRSGRPLLLRTRADWEGDVDTIMVRSSDDAPQSAVYVPVKYSDSVLGIVAVGSPQAERFDRDDVRLLEAVGRYLAIAIRNQRALRIIAAPIRFPWSWIAAALVAAVVATAFVTDRTRVSIVASQEGARRAQTERLASIASIVSGQLAEDARFATITAAVLGPVRNDRPLTVALMKRLVQARENEDIYGVGAFYAPERFDTATHLYGPYVSMTGDQISVTINASEKTYNYPTLAWYRVGVAGHGKVVFSDAYTEDGVTFVSAVKAFYDAQGLAGVVTVDTLASSLRDVLRRNALADERVWLTDGSTTIVDAKAAMPPDQPETVVTPIAGTTWTLHLSSNFGQAARERRDALLVAFGAILLVWLVAGGVCIAIVRLHGNRRVAAGLKLQRAELQGEIATRIEAEERLRIAAYHDALTGLPNRAFFLDQLGDVLNQIAHSDGTEYAVLFIDLDRFYVVNDSFGHGAGDLLLASIAERLDAVIPPYGLLARLGGDEFVLMVAGVPPVLGEAISIAEGILDALKAPFMLGDRELYTGASIGIMVVDSSYTDAESVLRDADISMYRAKGTGRGRYAIFDRSMRDQAQHQLELEGDLRGAVERGEIEPYYQPIVRLSDRSLAGFEALARWNRTGHGVVTAGEFVPLAEQSGLLRAIDVAVFEQVCADASMLASYDIELRISVNLSAADLTRASVFPDIEAALDRFGLDTRAFTLEITETAVMDDADRALAVLQDLRKRGFAIVIDDFGAGYSSLSYLQRLPVSGVKIDRSFVVPLPGDTQALEIVRAIVALAKTLNLYVTAEGVETAEQVELLATLGVDYVQGFFLSPPVDLAGARSLLAVTS